MSTRIRISLYVLFALGSAGVLGNPAEGADASGNAAQMATYTAPSGASYFALSLKADAPGSGARDVVVLFDTSASQTGPVRDKALATLEQMLSQMDRGTRVRLMAVDLNAVPMTEDFVSLGSAELAQAMAQLRARVPLGATDMNKALSAAADSFGDGPGEGRAAVYVGDGVSAAAWMSTDVYGALMNKLAAKHVPVSSYAIGAKQDSQLLASVANHTGGMIASDADATTAAQAGSFLAKSLAGHVVWPTQATWPAGLTEVYPQTMPPLRSDRETIVVGKGALAAVSDVKVEGDSDGQAVELNWTVEPSPSNDEAAYLVSLVDYASKDGGWGLPTAGIGGLAEARRIVNRQASELNKLGRLAVASGSLDEAERLAGRAAELDPVSPDASAIQRAVARQRETGDAGVVELQLVNDEQVELAEGGESLDPLSDAGALVDEVNQRNDVIRGYMQTEVRNAIADARAMMRTEPQTAIDRLKLVQESVANVPELSPEVRAQLRDSLDAALREASRQAYLKTERDLQNQELAAAVEDRRQVLESLLLKEQKIDQLMKRFESLVAQEQFLDAEILARNARELDPHRLATGLGETKSHMQQSLREQQDLRYRRQVGLIDTLASVERSHIPTPDEPPILYPDPEVWRRLTKRRKEFDAVDLAQTGPAEEKILSAMDEQTDFPFVATPLEEVVQYIGQRHNIPVHLVQTKLEDAGIGSDTEVTLELRGVTLRSALRQLTREIDGLTYLIDNEILQFTSTEDAESRPPVIKVYPVADLVVPVSSGMGGGMMGGGMMGGGMGGGMGGMGGGMGGMGGGMGGMGGGMGGMGGGMGGMGGGMFNIPAGNLPFGNMLQQPNGFRAFAVKDDLKLSGSDEPAPAAPVEKTPAAATPAPAKSFAPLPVTVADGEDAAQKYNDYLSNNEAEPAAIAESAKRLMHERKFDQVVALLQAAMRNGLSEPWMYEGMSLAMQAQGAPPADVERGLMSALDFCSLPEDVMYLAAYMNRAGFPARSLELFRMASGLAPMRLEPLVHGLNLAEQLGDLDGIQWATTGVLSQAWGKDQQEIWNRAYRLAKTTLDGLRNEGRTEEAKKYEKALDVAVARDCVAVVSWTGDCDIDLTVQEPGETVCSFRQPRTTGGGVMLGDSYSRTDTRSSDGIQEVYVCPQGFDGTYKVLVRKVWGKPTTGKVTVDIYTHYGTDHVTHVGKQIPVGDTDAMVVFELKDGRRTESLDEQLVANAAVQQMEVKQHILAQQLNQLSDSSSMAGFAMSRRMAQAGMPFGFVNPQAGVGYAPIITQLPKGAVMRVLPSVISADRRYVRVSPVPFFSGVSEVNTFNFATGQSGTSGGAGFGGFSSTPGAGGVGS
jgi:hypothetical protein